MENLTVTFNSSETAILLKQASILGRTAEELVRAVIDVQVLFPQTLNLEKMTSSRQPVVIPMKFNWANKNVAQFNGVNAQLSTFSSLVLNTVQDPSSAALHNPPTSVNIFDLMLAEDMESIGASTALSYTEVLSPRCRIMGVVTRDTPHAIKKSGFVVKPLHTTPGEFTEYEVRVLGRGSVKVLIFYKEGTITFHGDESDFIIGVEFSIFTENS